MTIRKINLIALLLLLSFTYSHPENTKTIPINYKLNTKLQSIGNVKKLINFLTGDNLLQQGNPSYMSTEGKSPLSYYSKNIDYWGEYIQKLEGDLAVHDEVETDPDKPWSLLGRPLDSSATRAQIERVINYYGVDIYDSATWQIALSLAYYQGLLDFKTANQLIKTSISRLNKAPSSAERPYDHLWENNGFTYGNNNEIEIKNLQYAYNLRMLAPYVILPDPFKGTKYAHLVKSCKLGPKFDKCISWADYKPITGENIWANLIGPLQALVLLYKNDTSRIPIDHPYIENAYEFLWVLQHQQTELGAILYAPNRSLDNAYSEIPSGTVSTENCASAVAGLMIFHDLLLEISSTAPDMKPIQIAKINTAINAIHIMMYGGKSPQGRTIGLLRYFKNYAKNPSDDSFLQGGKVKNGLFFPSEGSQSTYYAVDVNTWGVAVLGPKTIDSWYGHGASYKIWENVKKHGSYIGNDGKVWGVGYTDNYKPVDGYPAPEAYSSEWSFGALNMLQIMIKYYTTNKGITAKQLAILKEDEKNIIKNITKLRSDKYLSTYRIFERGINPKYQAKLPKSEQAFIYSSNRNWIPFGWFGNPMPSTCGTSWAIFASFSYNPFYLYGSQDSFYFDIKKPPKYNKNDFQLAWDSTKVTIINRFHHGNDDARISVIGKMKDGTKKFLISHEDSLEPGEFRKINITDDLSSIIFQAGDVKLKNQWSTACIITLTPDVREKLERQPINTYIEPKWCAGGEGGVIGYDRSPKKFDKKNSSNRKKFKTKPSCKYYQERYKK